MKDVDTNTVIAYIKTLEIDASKGVDTTNNICTVPIAEGNTDYQEYLAWVAEGNTPEPADEE